MGNYLGYPFLNKNRKRKRCPENEEEITDSEIGTKRCVFKIIYFKSTITKQRNHN